MVVAPEDTLTAQDRLSDGVSRRKQVVYDLTVVYRPARMVTDRRGYETWLATSDDLLQWKTLGRLLCYADKGWDMNQRAGYPALIDWTWNGS